MGINIKKNDTLIIENLNALLVETVGETAFIEAAATNKPVIIKPPNHDLERDYWEVETFKDTFKFWEV